MFPLNLRHSLFKIYYLRIYSFIAETRINHKDLSPVIIHTTLTLTLTTAILMWSYSLVAFIAFPIATPGIIGILCATIHTLSPLLFRYTKNPTLVINTPLTTALIFQIVFSFYSNGFTSRALIWFGILPFFAGLVGGIKAALTWAAIGVSAAIVFLILDLTDYPFPNLLTENGKIFQQAFLIFGWIFLSSITMIGFDTIKKEFEETKQAQAQNIEDLVKVLFHDLASPLGRMSIGLNLTKKGRQELTIQGIEIATQATEAMIEITQNVRRMYAVSMGKEDLDIVPCSLSESVRYCSKHYASELEKKKITLDFDYHKYKDLFVLADAVSFKSQVICNILSNAIKFSQVGQTISISAFEIQKGIIEIQIQDQGIGMPPQILDSLFDLTKKTTRIGTIGENGTGFGMHIMKSFIELYGGKVKVSSHEKSQTTESGTLFKLTLGGYWNY